MTEAQIKKTDGAEPRKPSWHVSLPDEVLFRWSAALQSLMADVATIGIHHISYQDMKEEHSALIKAIQEAARVAAKASLNPRGY